MSARQPVLLADLRANHPVDEVARLRSRVEDEERAPQRDRPWRQQRTPASNAFVTTIAVVKELRHRGDKEQPGRQAAEKEVKRYLEESQSD